MPQAKHFADLRGVLCAVESGREVPFVIRRVYWMDQLSPQHARGFHAHRTLQQAMFCLRGRCDLLVDDGKTRQSIHMDTPDKFVLIDKMVWREMHNFSSDCLLMVLASDYYDEADYIRDYDEFLQTMEK